MSKIEIKEKGGYLVVTITNNGESWTIHQSKSPFEDCDDDYYELVDKLFAYIKKHINIIKIK